MVKNHHLARSIHDASWNMLINFTTYKVEEAGCVVELVNTLKHIKTMLCLRLHSSDATLTESILMF
ncbi:MAG: hypothetical protein EF813_11140 [Methanosarcinales archaeon]|nr:MAG: hypothetical protein EF813_11140 [Methanosarcinales archaeon]